MHLSICSGLAASLNAKLQPAAIIHVLRITIRITALIVAFDTASL